MTIVDDNIIRNTEDVANITRGFLYNRIKDTARPNYWKERNALLNKYPFLKYNNEIVLPNFDNRGNIIGSELKIDIFKNKKKTDLFLSFDISLNKFSNSLYELQYYSYKTISQRDIILSDKSKSNISTMYLNSKLDSKLLYNYKVIDEKDEIKIKKFQLSHLIPYELENYHSNLNTLIDNYLNKEIYIFQNE